MKTYPNGVPTVETLRKDGYKVRVYHGRYFPTFNFGRGEYVSKREVVTKYNYDDASFVSSFGGFTRVEVSKDGQTAVGKYNFGNRQFNRKIGLQAAIGRALHNLNVVHNACNSESHLQEIQ